MHRPHSVSVPEILLPVSVWLVTFSAYWLIQRSMCQCEAEDKDTSQEDDFKKGTILHNLLSNNSELTVTAHELFRKQGQTFKSCRL